MLVKALLIYCLLVRYNIITAREGGETDFHGAGGPIAIENAKKLHLVSDALIEAGSESGMPVLDDTNGPEPEGVGPIIEIKS